MLGLGLSSNDVKLCPTSLPHLYCCFSLNDVVVVVLFLEGGEGLGGGLLCSNSCIMDY